MSIQWKRILLAAIWILPQYGYASLTSEFRTLYLKSAPIKDFEKLLPKLEKANPTEKALVHMGLGKRFFETEDDKNAQLHLSESIRLGVSTPEHAALLLGKSFYRTGSYEAAKIQLSNVIKKDNYLKQEAQLELAKVLMAQNQLQPAGQLLNFLLRRNRNSPTYPEVLWQSILLDLANNRPTLTCTKAKNLFSDHPTFESISHWNLEDRSLVVNERRLPCSMGHADHKKRLRNFILNGMSDRAKTEVDSYVKLNSEKNKFEAESLLAYYFVQDGYPVEAFKVLAPYYNSHKSDYDYLLQLATAAVRAGEFQTAVGAYYRAHGLKEKSRSGRMALYHSAFLSYQFQDYDGAARKFEEFISKYRGSGLSLDARWHLAWIKYLKRDFKGALADFNEIQKFRRLARQDRVIYWKAMTYFHLEDFKNATSLFQRLINEEAPTYYSAAAKARMEQLKTKSVNRHIASSEVESTVDESLTENDIIVSEENESEEHLADIEDIAEREKEEGKVADWVDESEPDLADIIGSDQAVLKAPSKRRTETSLLIPKEFSSNISNANFRLAQDFISLGFYDWARWELYQIERRTRDKQELMKLISYYSQIEAYHRVSHIASNRLARERRAEGVGGHSSLWKWAYPQAYKDIVMTESKKRKVDPDFVWSIMRAESNFREDAVSPVGALGLMQVMPFTAERVANLEKMPYDVSKLTTASYNIPIGTIYLSRLYNMFNGQIPLAAAGYNAGPHRVKSWIKNFGNLEMDEFIEHIPFVETRNYVKRVTQNYYTYQSIYSEQPTLRWLASSIPYTYTGPTPTRENWN